MEINKMTQEIFNEIKNMFKYCDIQQDRVIFSDYANNDKSLLPMYEINDSGIYIFERGYKIQTANLGSLSLNMLGFYARMKNNSMPDNATLDKITNAKSENEIYNIFISKFGNDFLKDNLFINYEGEIDNAYQLIVDSNEYAINYVAKNKYFVVVPKTKLNVVELCSFLFKVLSVKQQFDEKVVPQIDFSSIGSEELLKLFATYMNQVPTRIRENEKIV